MPRKHLVIYGTVQGVGFRAFARRAALSTGVPAGWVRNRADGAVELEAEAEDAAMTVFADLIRKGPSFGHVSHVEELPVSNDVLPRPFTIVH